MGYSTHENEDVELGMKLLSDLSPRDSISSSVSGDLEANKKNFIDQNDLELDNQPSTRVKYTWLLALLVFGMLLTIHNKYILAMVNIVLSG